MSDRNPDLKAAEALYEQALDALAEHGVKLHKRLQLDGFEVELTRSKIDGSVLIYVDTQDASGDDVDPNGSPRLRIMVNDEVSDSDSCGGWITEQD